MAKRKQAHLVETGHNVTEVDPGCARLSYLVEQVISEELQQITVTSFRPCWILLEPTRSNSKLGFVNVL